MSPRNNPGLHIVSGGRRYERETLAAYRPYTRALMRRYFRMAVDIGRLPSILGGLCFRARVSSYRLQTFEDSVIFVHDVERIFDRMQRHAMEIVAGVLLLEYSIPEAALRLGITVQRAERRFAAALDALSAALLESGLLRPVFESSEASDRNNCSEEALPPLAPTGPIRTDRGSRKPPLQGVPSAPASGVLG